MMAVTKCLGAFCVSLAIAGGCADRRGEGVQLLPRQGSESAKSDVAVSVDNSKVSNFGFVMDARGSALFVGSREYDEQGYEIRVYDFEQNAEEKWRRRDRGELHCLAAGENTLASLVSREVRVHESSTGILLASGRLPGTPLCPFATAGACFAFSAHGDNGGRQGYLSCRENMWKPKAIDAFQGYLIAAGHGDFVVGLLAGKAQVWKLDSDGQLLSDSELELPKGDPDNAVLGAEVMAIRIRSPDNLSATLHIYRRREGGWELEQSLSSGAFRDSFGYGLALEGGFLAVGAPSSLVEGAPHGGVYLYSHEARHWKSQTLRMISEKEGDEELAQLLGSSVAVVGARESPTIVVGAPGLRARARYGVPKFAGRVCYRTVGAAGTGDCFGP